MLSGEINYGRLKNFLSVNLSVSQMFSYTMRVMLPHYTPAAILQQLYTLTYKFYIHKAIQLIISAIA